MPKLTKHVRTEILILSALLLGSCEDMARTMKPSEVHDIAADVAADTVEDAVGRTVRDHEDRIAELEHTVEQMENRLRVAEYNSQR